MCLCTFFYNCNVLEFKKVKVDWREKTGKGLQWISNASVYLGCVITASMLLEHVHEYFPASAATALF